MNKIEAQPITYFLILFFLKDSFVVKNICNKNTLGFSLFFSLFCMFSLYPFDVSRNPLFEICAVSLEEVSTASCFAHKILITIQVLRGLL